MTHIQASADGETTAAPRVADRVRAHDWASTPLGRREDWPQSLCTAIDIMLASGHPMCIMWGPQRIFFYNDAYAPLLGSQRVTALGMRTADVWPEVWDDIEPLVERTFAGETCTLHELPLIMTRNGPQEETWWDFSYSPVHDETGRVAGLFNVTLESTSRVLANRERDAAIAALEAGRTRQRMLNDELAHRMKNMFGMVQAIAFQTLRRTEDSAAVEAFDRRLAVLASAHDILTERNWSNARFGDLARTVTDTFDGNRFTLNGPDVEIGSRAALALSLTLHELATNAVKYGALSVADGRVDLRWSLLPDDEGEQLEFCWVERGGPPAREPTRKGFGSRLIRMGLIGSGGVELNYSPHGLTVQACAPLHLMQQA